MKHLNDLDLILKIKNENNSDCLQELINRHAPLCSNIYKRYIPALLASGKRIPEIIEDRDYIVYKSVNSFNPIKKVKFSSWLGNHIKYQCLDAINDKKRAVWVSMDEKELYYFLDKEQKEEDESKDELEYINNILNQVKDKRIKDIFSIRYFSGEKKASWRQIAKKLNISSQTVINLHEKGKAFLKNKLLSEKSIDFI